MAAEDESRNGTCGASQASWEMGLGSGHGGSESRGAEKLEDALASNNPTRTQERQPDQFLLMLTFPFWKPPLDSCLGESGQHNPGVNDKVSVG